MMADEQPNTPSEGVQTPDAAAPESASDQQQEGSSPGWWSRLLNRRPAQEVPSKGEEPDQPGPSASDLPRTQEELERRIQAETDRREAQRAARQRAEERKKLRDADPWAYAEQERQAEQSQEQDQGIQQFFANVGLQHDRIAIDPVMESLPQAERERIMKIEGAGRGLEGRRLVVDEALKSLAKHWKAEGEKEAEAKLRRNQAFRKQILAEARGGVVEPDLLPALSSSAADQKMSDILRDFYGVGGARHNSA